MTRQHSEPHGRVVAVVLIYRGTVGLLRRSPAVASDRGRWHCVTGFVPERRSAASQALVELREETGLTRGDLTSFVTGPLLRLADANGGSWLVHTYRCSLSRPDIELNWENDGICWVDPRTLGALEIVDWLPDVVHAVGLSEPPVRRVS